jgi:hypothetical protein
LRILAIALLLCVPSLAQESTPAPPTYDFQSDAKPNKLNARLMLKMQNDINQKTLPKLQPDPPDTDKPQVTCFTCHQKQLKPPPPPPPAH